MARSEPQGWTAAQPVPLASGRLSPAVLAETLDGGQAFRWNRQPDDTWLGVFGEHIARLSLDATGALQWSTPRAVATPATATRAALVRYLDLERDPHALADALPWRSDAHLARCVAAFPGLRILRQPFGETLLGFLCSATKQIVQIKQMLALLAARHGAALQLRTPNPELGTPASAAHRLPTWPELAAIPEADLRACLLGFRARYIHETAQFLAAHPGWLYETEALPYVTAKERLCSLPGVGENDRCTTVGNGLWPAGTSDAISRWSFRSGPNVSIVRLK